jgi:hypothetical protein
MKRTAISIIAVVLVLLAFAADAWAGDYAAMVMDIQNGPARHADGPLEGKALEVMEFLYEPDAVAVPADATLVLNYFDSAKREEIKGPATITITRTQSRPLHDQKTQIASATVDYMPAKSDLAHLQMQNFGNVAFRKVGPAAKQENTLKIAVLSLSDTAILSAETAVLRWRPVAGADHYVVKLFDDGRTMKQKIQTKENSAAFDARYLLPGQSYSWTLSAIKINSGIENTDGRFRILSADERHNLDRVQNRIETKFPDKSTEGLLLLNLHFQRHDLRDDAAQILMELHRLHPKNTLVVGQLRKLNPNLIK